jgi:hypothetical protein
MCVYQVSVEDSPCQQVESQKFLSPNAHGKVDLETCIACFQLRMNVVETPADEDARKMR